MAEALVPIPSENDWEISKTGRPEDWLMNQNEPLGALVKRIRWSVPPDTIVRIGFPERVPGTGPSWTAPFRIGDAFVPVEGGNSEPVLQVPTAQRNLEWWLFTTAPTPPPIP